MPVPLLYSFGGESNVNKWFSEVFLPSLFSRAGVNRNIWLTQRQTEICTQYMDKHNVRWEAGAGEHWNRTWYDCDWNGRKVSMSYSKKNGCGCINFGMDANEQRVGEQRAKEEKERIAVERARRLYLRRPERWRKEIDDLLAENRDMEESIEEDKFDDLLCKTIPQRLNHIRENERLIEILLSASKS